MPKVRDDSINIRHTCSWHEEFGRGDQRYWKGVIFTPQGIVAYYQEPGYTALQFVCEGQWWTRKINASYSRRYTVTLANRFAKEITEQ